MLKYRWGRSERELTPYFRKIASNFVLAANSEGKSSVVSEAVVQFWTALRRYHKRTTRGRGWMRLREPLNPIVMSFLQPFNCSAFTLMNIQVSEVPSSIGPGLRRHNWSESITIALYSKIAHSVYDRRIRDLIVYSQIRSTLLIYVCKSVASWLIKILNLEKNVCAPIYAYILDLFSAYSRIEYEENA